MLQRELPPYCIMASSTLCSRFIQKNLGALAWQWAKGIASPIVGAINANPAQGVILVDEKK